MVESGTLLRCYTSKRGIEGSNPSSSAPKAAYLQGKREGKEKDRDFSQPSFPSQPLMSCSCNGTGRKYQSCQGAGFREALF